MVEDASLNKAKLYSNKVRDSFQHSKVSLFGSYVSGKQHRDSDIDIAIVLDDFKDRLDITIELMRLRRSIDSRIEPHPFRLSDFNSNNILAHEVINNGLEI